MIRDEIKAILSSMFISDIFTDVGGIRLNSNSLE